MGERRAASVLRRIGGPGRRAVSVGVGAGILLTLSCLAADEAIRIDEGVHENRRHFVVRGGGVEYWYDAAGGGFSRIIDRDGHDWVGFRSDPLSAFPDSAAAGYRGIPNLVFDDAEDRGAGHPGRDRCESVRVGEAALRSVSRSGRWQWRWDFRRGHAEFTMERVPEGGRYWFLYEGTPGGRFAPGEQFWGADGLEAPVFEAPDYLAGRSVAGSWGWAYFGDRRVERALVAVQLGGVDGLPDTVGWMGASRAGLRADDGMVVFGFGRRHDAGVEALLGHAGARFAVGLIDGVTGDAAGHLLVGRAVAGIVAPKPLVVAHRGASADAPENTMAAFRRAWLDGADAIEGDFWMSADGEIVCLHDASLERVAGVARDVREMALEELRALDVGRWKDARWEGERIPLLRDVIECVPDGGRLLIEIKDSVRVVPRVAEVVEAFAAEDRGAPILTIISFNESVVRAAKDMLPKTDVYWLVGAKEVEKDGVDQIVRRALALGADGLDAQATSAPLGELARRTREAGLEFHVWTVNDVSAVPSLVAAGVDSITTDVPAGVRAALGR